MNNNGIELSSQADQNTDPPRVRKSAGYRSPCVIEIGKAKGLVRNAFNGNIRDYCGGSWRCYA